MSLFVASLGLTSKKESMDIILIGDMDISWIIVYVQQVEEEKLRHNEEYKNKKATIIS